MAKVKLDTTIKEYQAFVDQVYGLSNDRHFSIQDMLTNVERFNMRALKGIRKNDIEKIKINLFIAQSWFMSFLNQVHTNIEEEVWKRFPYKCSYCDSCPCICNKNRELNKLKIEIDHNKKPKTFKEYQEMFNKIYPAKKRTLEHAGVHLAEELGELSEAVLVFLGKHEEIDFKKVVEESADLFSCIMGVFNSLDVDVAKELSILFDENCHACHKVPCECDYVDITNYKS